MSNLDLWTGTSQGVQDEVDPDVVTVAWAVQEGVELLGASIVEGGLLIVKFRVPVESREGYANDRRGT